MNINLTTYCNLKCPYCFARDLWESAGNEPDDKEISIKNLKNVIDFMKKSGVREFRMIGGEPTLHSRFKEVYDIVSKNGFWVTIFSNGTIAKEKTEFLAKQKNISSIIINIQHPAVYSLKQREMLNFTLSKLNKFINLGFVVYKTDFNARFIIKLVEKYNLRDSVKFSIAAPSLKNKNVYVELKNHKKVIRRLLELSRIFRRHNIAWYPDTTFMWCFFTKKQLDELYLNVGFKPVNFCHPVLEVAPNLTVYRCYGTASLSNPKLKITDFKDDKDARSYFFRKEMLLKNAGVLKGCLRCDLKGEVCGAGCIAQILRSFPKRDYDYIY
jgi:MoaA/NifB/PqqE/SkfB family radical SAM enzyme